MQTNIIELISNSCGCSQTEAQEYLDSEIRYLRELQEADDLRGDDIGMACSNLGLVNSTEADADTSSGKVNLQK